MTQLEILRLRCLIPPPTYAKEKSFAIRANLGAIDTQKSRKAEIGKHFFIKLDPEDISWLPCLNFSL
jgi:hypothetical protein